MKYDIDKVQVCPVRAAKEGKTLVELTGDPSLASLDKIHAKPDYGLDLANARKSFRSAPSTGSLITDREQELEKYNEFRKKHPERNLPPRDVHSITTLSGWYTIPCRAGKEEAAASALGNGPNIQSADVNWYHSID